MTRRSGERRAAARAAAAAAAAPAAAAANAATACWRGGAPRPAAETAARGPTAAALTRPLLRSMPAQGPAPRTRRMRCQAQSGACDRTRGARRARVRSALRARISAKRLFDSASPGVPAPRSLAMAFTVSSNLAPLRATAPRRSARRASVTRAATGQTKARAHAGRLLARRAAACATGWGCLRFPRSARWPLPLFAAPRAAQLRVQPLRATAPHSARPGGSWSVSPARRRSPAPSR